MPFDKDQQILGQGAKGSNLTVVDFHIHVMRGERILGGTAARLLGLPV